MFLMHLTTLTGLNCIFDLLLTGNVNAFENKYRDVRKYLIDQIVIMFSIMAM